MKQLFNPFVYLYVATAFVLLSLLPGTAAETPLNRMKAGDLDGFRKELEMGADANLADERGVTALMYATRYYSTREMKWLLDHGADPNARSKAKFTAFNFAVADRAKAELLMDRGFRFKSSDTNFPSALMIATRHPRGFEVVSLLIAKGADVNEKGPGGATALQRSVKSGDLRIVKLLVENGANVNDASGKGLFFNSVLTGKDEIARYLIEKGADLNASDGFAGHSLGAALVNGNFDLARELIVRGADINAAKGIGEVPPIVYAAHSESGEPELVKLLLEKGANIASTNDRDETALTWARKRGQTDLVRYLEGKGARDPASPRKAASVPSNAVQLTGENSRALIQASVKKALSILETGSEGFLDRDGRPDNCVSCHHQTLPGIAFGWAAKLDLMVNAALVERQIDSQKMYWRKSIAKAWEYEDPVGGGAANVGHGMMNLAANRYAPDEVTEAMSFYLAGGQLADGGWATFVGRPPAESTRIASSAFALRSLQLYPPKESNDETKRREELARAFFLRQNAVTTEERSFGLLGLLWSRAPDTAIRKHSDDLLEAQRPDGGWAQIPSLESDAYATGQSLVALVVSHQLSPNDSRSIRAVEFLLVHSSRTAHGLLNQGPGRFRPILTPDSLTDVTNGFPRLRLPGPHLLF